LGLYTRSYNLLAVATQILGDPAFRALFPAFSRMQQDPARLQSGFRRGLGIAIPLYAFVSGVALLHGEALVRIILGSRWLDAVMPLQLLFFAFAARAGYKFTESLLLAMGQFGQTAIRQFIYFALIGIAAFFGSRFGVSGVAAGVALALWIFYVISLKWVHDTIDVGWRWLVLLHVRAVVLAAGGASFDIAVQASLTPSGYWLAQVSGAVAFCGFCVGVTMTGPTWLIGLEVRDIRKLLVQELSRRLGRFGV
jgi:PST family polysaccharide transporter